jgi:hypothetical protein
MVILHFLKGTFLTSIKKLQCFKTWLFYANIKMFNMLLNLEITQWLTIWRIS